MKLFLTTKNFGVDFGFGILAKRSYALYKNIDSETMSHIDMEEEEPYYTSLLGIGWDSCHVYFHILWIEFKYIKNLKIKN